MQAVAPVPAPGIALPDHYTQISFSYPLDRDVLIWILETLKSYQVLEQVTLGSLSLLECSLQQDKSVGLCFLPRAESSVGGGVGKGVESRQGALCRKCCALNLRPCLRWAARQPGNYR